MRRLLTIAILLMPLHGQNQAPAPCLDRPPADRSYTQSRLLDVVRLQTPIRATYLIRTCGVRVPLTAQLEAELREAGAEDGVIAVVREAAPRPAAPPPQLPTIANCTATPDEIGSPGEPVSLGFTPARATAVMLNGLAITNPVTVQPTKTTTYTLIAHNATGQTASCQVTVRLREAPPAISSCAATPNEIANPGEPVSIAFTSTGASAVTLNGLGITNRSPSGPQKRRCTR